MLVFCWHQPRQCRLVTLRCSFDMARVAQGTSCNFSWAEATFDTFENAHSPQARPHSYPPHAAGKKHWKKTSQLLQCKRDLKHTKTKIWYVWRVSSHFQPRVLRPHLWAIVRFPSLGSKHKALPHHRAAFRTTARRAIVEFPLGKSQESSLRRADGGHVWRSLD